MYNFEILKSALIADLLSNPQNLDTIYITNKDKDYTYRDMAQELENNSEIALKMIVNCIKLAAHKIIRQNQFSESYPKIGDYYQHHNGEIYEILQLTNIHSTNEKYPVQVVYRGFNGKIWSKDIDNFKITMSKL